MYVTVTKSDGPRDVWHLAFRVSPKLNKLQTTFWVSTLQHISEMISILSFGKNMAGAFKKCLLSIKFVLALVVQIIWAISQLAPNNRFPCNCLFVWYSFRKQRNSGQDCARRWSNWPFWSWISFVSKYKLSSQWYSTYPLELIVGSAPDVFVRIADNSHHEICRLSLIQVQSKTVTEAPNGWFTLERRQSSVQHKLDCVNDLVRKRPDCEEPFHCQALEYLITLWVFSAHQNNHFVVKFERVRFKFDTLGWY